MSVAKSLCRTQEADYLLADHFLIHLTIEDGREKHEQQHEEVAPEPGENRSVHPPPQTSSIRTSPRLSPHRRSPLRARPQGHHPASRLPPSGPGPPPSPRPAAHP